ncbi:MAG: DUF3570 domain-containing protein [Fibrobacteria bacterium]
MARAAAIAAAGIALFSLLSLLCARPARADEIEYSVYYFRDNNENTVATSAFSLAKTLYEKTLISLNIEMDQTTVPPLLDGVTGASRPARQSKSAFRKNRGQIIGGLEQTLGENTRVMGKAYFSQEVDYQSLSFIGGISQDFAQKNFIVDLRGQYIVDSVGEILANGSILNRFKETHLGTLNLTQVVSPTAFVHGCVGITRIHGFQSDPYRKVEIATANPSAPDTIIERHPDMRWRQVVGLGVNKYLRDIDGAFSIDYKYYWDDWGLASNTAHFQFNKYITKDWIVSPSYRYYDQAGVTYGEYLGGGMGAFDTEDYKLKIFGSNGAGLKVACFLRAFGRKHPAWEFLNNTAVSAEYFHYFNDMVPENFSADLFETRLRFAF